MGSHPTAMASCRGDKTGLHCQDQKRSLGRNPPRHRPSPLRRQRGHSRPKKVILPRVMDFAISVVGLLVPSEKSNPSGIELGCIDFTDVFHTLGRRGLFFPDRLRLGRVPAILSRVGQSMFEPEEPRAQTYVDDPAGVTQGHASPPACPFNNARASLGSHGRKSVLEERQVWRVYRLDRHHDHRPPTLRFQCSVDGDPSAQSRRTPGPYGKILTQKRTRGRQRSFTCRWSPRLGLLSLPVANF